MIPMEFGEILTMLFWGQDNVIPPPHGATMDSAKCFYSSAITILAKTNKLDCTASGAGEKEFT